MSFYNDRDEAIAPILTKLLLETKQAIPSILQDFMPTGDDLKNLKFYEDVDENGDDTGSTGDGGGWGGGGNLQDPAGGDGWGTGGVSQAPAAGNDGWGDSAPVSAPEVSW
jgi:hypothetical protein